MFSRKHYLGDGLYVHFDGYHFILSTQRYDERDPKWDICGLEPPVFDNLINYRREVYTIAENLTDEDEKINE